MITPVEIKEKEFERARKGYREDEVDDFLNRIIVDLEQILEENRKLKEAPPPPPVVEVPDVVEQEQSKDEEGSVLETLESARNLMSEISASAEKRAALMLQNAEMEAKLIKKEAVDSMQQLTEENRSLRKQLEDFRLRYKQLLESELNRFDILTAERFPELYKDRIEETVAQEVPKQEVPTQEMQAPKAEPQTVEDLLASEIPSQPVVESFPAEGPPQPAEGSFAQGVPPQPAEGSFVQGVPPQPAPGSYAPGMPPQTAGSNTPGVSQQEAAEPFTQETPHQETAEPFPQETSSQAGSSQTALPQATTDPFTQEVSPSQTTKLPTEPKQREGADTFLRADELMFRQK